MLDIIFDNIYFKLIIAIILALFISFSNEVEIFYKPYILFIIGIVTIFLFVIDSKIDMGILYLMVALFVVVYNQQIHASIKTNTKTS